ncbi:hypothetical protein VIBNISFn27_1010012 [Vibrio nigripulchritudo SFn27]|uniref:Uncharacterized protein n=2 Tax=Vibrio nigripulchritudo TaxID=28173 RepID=U4K220_9VIBR|nr:hypothetical protein VIBNIBLFn1_560062 [Vibrio nigripulchritudo BLFn1]CCN86243.1 hypothetical protein VIBNISFn27_1010012 [Vibrio nigripulchritudo SFn27]CCN92803.1 hypothetical protein VIBNIENn2_1070103 [Vibrio nigripulchritudo ENn2]CCO42761.1 hypothetical protein VIBNISFn135_840061 [Vibrio nigripulchritudo SFn135]CCO52627.1 hypothetical protein VIBNIWn13_360060 [Vibrio nigripulchritudo Wn13]CCO56694.1 hypothetical protein VIBNI_A0504 [Vibrio nigripulchritudo]
MTVPLIFGEDYWQAALQEQMLKQINTTKINRQGTSVMTRRVLFTATTLALTTVSAFAVSGETYTQNFSGFADQTDRGSWGTITFTPGEPSLTPSDKAAYTNASDELLFEVRWTWNTMRRMLGKPAFNKLRKEIGVQKLRELIDEQCEARVEVGTQRTYNYGAPSVGGYVAEMDSDIYHCNRNNPKITVNGVVYPLSYPQKSSTVNMRTFVPTTPGSKYTLTIKYHKRNYNYSRFGINANQAYRNMNVWVRGALEEASLEGLGDIAFTGQRVRLPANPAVSDANQEDGFNVATISFTANRFYTPVALADSGHPDSYGLLINEIQTEVTEENPFKETCELFFPPNSGGLKKCLTSGGEETPSILSCNLEIDETLGNFKVNREGYRIESEPWRYDPNNLFHAKNYYSVGKAGISTLRLANNGQFSGCPIYGKTLKLEEFTGNNWDYERYAEQGWVQVRLACLDENNLRVARWETLETDHPDNLLITAKKIDKVFNDDNYQSCLLRAIRFVDRTHTIPEDQPGYDANSDGYEIRNVRIED